MILVIAPCLRQRYCKYGVRSRVTYRNNACGKRAAYTFMVDSTVEYICWEHFDKRLYEIRYQMDSQLKRHGVITDENKRTA